MVKGSWFFMINLLKNLFLIFVTSSLGVVTLFLCLLSSKKQELWEMIYERSNWKDDKRLPNNGK